MSTPELSGCTVARMVGRVTGKPKAFETNRAVGLDSLLLRHNVRLNHVSRYLIFLLTEFR